ASAGVNNAIHVFETANGAEVRPIPGHDAPVNAVGLARDGAHLITSSMTGRIQGWNAKTGARGRSWIVPPEKDFVLATAPAAQTVVTGGDGLRFWDSQTGKEKMQLPGKPGESPVSLLYSPDGARLAVGRHDGSVEVWDIGQKKVIHQLKHEGPAYALAFT